MTCDEYLHMLSTASPGALLTSGGDGHTSWCQDCSRVTRVVLERERNLASAYGDLQSQVPASYTAEEAMATSRRRIVGRMYSIALAVTFVVASIAIAVSFTRPKPMYFEAAANPLSTETFPLQCMTAEQAGDLLSPYIRSNGSAYYTKGSPRLLTVRATIGELAKVKSMLGRFDIPSNGSCGISSAPKIAP